MLPNSIPDIQRTNLATRDHFATTQGDLVLFGFGKCKTLSKSMFTKQLKVMITMVSTHCIADLLMPTAGN
jgi:hypothetical protein